MSIYQMVKVWEHEFSTPQQVVMLALADHADDGGRSIKPGLERIAWKTGYSRRQVLRIVKDLRDTGVLIVMRNHGDGKPTEYRIDWTAAKTKPPYDSKSDNLSPPAEQAKVTFQDSKSDTGVAAKVTLESRKSDIAVSPEPSEPSLEPSKNRQEILPDKSHPKHSPPEELAEFYGAWNQHRGSLPECVNNAGVNKQLKAARKEYDHADLVTLISQGTQEVASDPFWVDKRYGLENLLRKLDSKAEAFRARGGRVRGSEKVYERRDRFRNFMGGGNA